MKQLLLSLTLVFTCTLAMAQTLPDLDAIKLETKEDFNTSANDAALQAATFLFTTPIDKSNVQRLKAVVYIIKWMSGTPDYNFAIDDEATKLSKKNEELMAMFMAAMAKYVLENKADARDQPKIKLNAVKMIIEYAKNEKNNVKISGELKKVMEADEKGELASYLKIGS